MEAFNRDFFSRDAVTVAKALLGCYIIRDMDGCGTLRARIVETEAYKQDDPACHAYGNWLRLQRGQAISGRSEILFGEPGRSYVYLNYGIHWLFNVVCGRRGVGAAVLVRAVEPVSGLERMQLNRRLAVNGPQLTNGPGKLSQALGIDGSMNGLDLLPSTPAGVLALEKGRARRSTVVTATRIGITKAADLPWRFYLADSAFVSVRGGSG